MPDSPSQPPLQSTGLAMIWTESLNRKTERQLISTYQRRQPPQQEFVTFCYLKCRVTEGTTLL